MINELNESFGLDLSFEYSTERHPKPATLIESSGSKTRKKIIFVSGSHSGYIATEFEDNVEIIDLSTRGLRITPESVDTMTTSLKEALAESDSPACVVYQFFS
jgi:hypothetical protein